jgi:predicted sugar kinase
MVLDYALLVEIIKPQVCLAGAVVFSVDLPTTARIRVTGNTNEIQVATGVERPAIVRHAALIMKAALGFSDGLMISVEVPHKYLHAGLGSTASLQVAIASAINYLYGSPIRPAALVRYLCQNYGEEIDGDEDHLIPVQSPGEAASAGLMGGGLLVITGEATVVGRMQLPSDKRFVIGMPHQYKRQDSLSAFSDDVQNFERLIQIGKLTGSRTAYEVLHRMLPAMVNGDLSEVGKVIRRDRLSEDNLNRFEIRYPGLKRSISGLCKLMDEKKIDVLSISSAGPGIFALTSRVDEVVEEFRRNFMEVIIAPPNNTGITYTAS